MRNPFRHRPDDLMAVADAVLPPIAPRLVLDDAEVALGIAELKVSWELPSYRRPKRRPPISPGPTSLVEES